MQVQDDRLLSIATPLGKDAFLLTEVAGEEGLSQLFHFDLDLLSDDKAIEARTVLGANVTFTVNTTDNDPVHFNGIVAQFSAGSVYGKDLRHYKMRLVPWMWFLTREADIRIFQKMSVKDIVTKIFADMGASDYTLELTKTYAAYDYKVQYRETDFAFVSRLLEEEGIYYFFRHDNGKHTLVLADMPTAVRPGALVSPTWHDEQGWQVVHAWQHGWEYRSGKWTVGDFNFETPKQDLTVSSTTVLDAKDMPKLERYDHPAGHANNSGGTALARKRIESEEAGYATVTGSGMVPSFHAGTSFKLQKHPAPAENRNYALVWVRHHIIDRSDGTSNQATVEYSNQFRAMPAETPYRPPLTTPRPVVHGPQTAFVVGPAGEEIYTDKYGRVKVQFHWDREGKYDEQSSCWLRVAQGWGGKQWGSQVLPRVGMEAIVTFLEGDPDHPIVSGILYNAEAMPPDALPDNRTRTVFRTKSTPKGDGYNEFSFEDKKGKEQVFTRAERDMEIRVKHDLHETVENERHLVVKSKAFEEVTGDNNLKVSGNRNEKVGGTVSLDIGSDLHLKTGQKLALKAGMDIMIETSPPFTLTLKAGGNFIMLGPAGISIVGSPLVQINSGGSAGPLTAEPKPPNPPKEADDRTPGQAVEPPSAKTRTPQALGLAQTPLQVVQAAALVDASTAGTPFCPLCAAAGALQNALGM